MRIFCLLAAAAILAFGLSACETLEHGGYSVTVASSPPPAPPVVVVHEHPGPPPHAPAHGYRHKHHDHGHDVELVYDTGLGCYTVAGYRDYYFRDGFYFRFGGDGWQVSATLGGDARWDYCADTRVPSGLKVKHKEKGHKGGSEKGERGKGKGNKKISSAGHWGKY